MNNNKPNSLWTFTLLNQQTKMSHGFIYLHFAVAASIIFLCTSSSTGKNTNYNYQVCSDNNVSCGTIQNVGYPFWGQNRPKFCGRPEFLLSCNQNNNTNPVIILSSATKAVVMNLDTSSHTMLLSLQPFSNHYDDIRCWPVVQKTSVANMSHAFRLTKRVTTISLFFNCTSNVSRYHFKSLACNSSSNNPELKPPAYYVDQSREFDRISKLCTNQSSDIPVLNSGLEELSEGTVTLLSVLSKGFEVDYFFNFSECSNCQSSGGTCGSELTSPTFVCYCKDEPHPQTCHKSGKKSRVFLGIGIGGGILVFITLIAGIWYYKHHTLGKKKRAAIDHSSIELERGSVYFGVPLFSYEELEDSTDHFHDAKELGGGGFGTVYYGKLKDGREVAVKRLYEKSYKRIEQFMNEVQILTCLRHQNLVSLYGCTSCKSRELLLVYEYVANGTVADHLYGDKAQSKSLSWPIRLRIAVETASALAYLHASDVIHRDVKTANILLDSSFSVKVADFGLSRLLPTDVTHVSTAPQGTPGYVDPEYHQCYQLTDKSDVYSFGIVLIELISSLPAVDMNRQKYEINLSNYALNRIQKCAFDDLIDPQLGFASDSNVRRMAISVAELAFQCLQHYKDFRPSMDEVLEVLKRIEKTNCEGLQSKNSSLSPTPDDTKVLLNNHQQRPLSPISVMDVSSSSSTSHNKSG